MILVVGLSPTVQRTLRFDHFFLGEVNRAREVLTTASGKGVNVARVLTTLGAACTLVHPLGGTTGRWLGSTLDADSVSHLPVWVEDDAPTRTCTTLLPNNAPTTELVEEAAEVSPHDASLLIAAIQTVLLDAQAACLSGSLPRGIRDDLYARIVREARVFGIPVLVDAQKAPLRLALVEKPFLVKPNREEAAATLGYPLTGDTDTDAHRAVDELTGAGTEWALVSMGKAGSLLGNTKGERWRIVSPDVEAVNPIGSGDSLTAGLLEAHFGRGLSVPDAAVWGTACAAANCLTSTSGVVRPDDAMRLLGAVRMTRL